MKLLHIADLHAGKTIGNVNQVSRNPDLMYALEQVERICKDEKVSVLLIAGDVYDKKNFDHKSQGLIFDFLSRISSLGVHTLLISGNHDSYDLLESYKPLSEKANIHVFDRLSTDLNKLIFQYEGLKVACLPYPSERILTKLEMELESEEKSKREYAEKVQNFIKALAKEVKSAQYSVLLGHVMVESAQIAGSEKQISILDTYAIRADSLPNTFHYIALGHVHRRQRIEKSPSKAYYSGSMYQIDFSEKGMPKSVNLVLLENGDVTVREIKLDLYRELKEYEIKDEKSFHKFINYDINHIGSAYVKIVYYMDPADMSSNHNREKIIQALKDKLVRLDVRMKLRDTLQTKDTYTQNDIIDMYVDYYKNTYGKAPSDGILEILRNILKEVEDETHKA